MEIFIDDIILFCNHRELKLQFPLISVDLCCFVSLALKPAAPLALPSCFSASVTFCSLFVVALVFSLRAAVNINLV